MGEMGGLLALVLALVRVRREEEGRQRQRQLVVLLWQEEEEQQRQRQLVMVVQQRGQQLVVVVVVVVVSRWPRWGHRRDPRDRKWFVAWVVLSSVSYELERRSTLPEKGSRLTRERHPREPRKPDTRTSL